MNGKPLLPTACLLLLSLSAWGGGCKDVRVDAGTDATFLHTPEELFAPVKESDKPLFPDQGGNKWTIRLMDSESGNEVQTLIGKRMISGIECQVFRSARDGRAYREEYYISNKSGIYQLGGGAGDQVIMVPPVPILTYPLELGKTVEWQGGISVPKGKVPARAWSRFRGTEAIKVPAGSFKAYRTDTALEANISGRLTVFTTARWFVPDIGIVKTRYVIRQAGQPTKEFRRELVRYEPAR